jgi:signal transduction histidine kinase
MAGMGVGGAVARRAPHVARELLAGPVQHSHIVQFYADGAFLADVVAQFVAPGLEAGGAAVVVMRAAHRDAVIERLRARSCDVDAHVRTGALALFDAAETLDRICVDGVLDRDRFRSVAAVVLDAAERAAGGARLRVYGEMVDVLCAAGRPEVALALERLWNELAAERDFTLLCGYDLARFGGETDAARLAHVCDEHTHVIPTEGYAELTDPDARLREVVQLQQRALALESEIAERKQIEAALRQSLRLRDDFLAVAGHELRTPLTAAQLMLESLSRGRRVALPVLAHERLHQVARSLARLGKLIDGLVDVARFAAGRAQLSRGELELGALVRGVVDEQMGTLQAAGCSVDIAADGEVRGRWDRGRLEQVVANLVSNAGKYSSGKPIAIRVERGAERARLVVRDQGVGIAPADQRRIFERFERAAVRPEVWGLGLGLWIAREVVEAHGGTISVESEVGRGSTFTVELPYA